MNGDIELPGYTIEKEIGRGGMSKVYLAHQHNFDMQVALKIMDTSLLGNPDFGARFFEEARTIKRLNHANVVGVNDVGMHGNYFYLSMEYLDGGHLKDKIKQGIGTEECLKIISEIAAALDYIHRRGFVHRDIKPDNVLFRSSGTAVLTDFGISRAVEGANHLTKTNMVIGTPNYMSPEQAKGIPVDFRSDIYSVGVLLFEMLTGELPYKGSSSVAVGIKHIIDPLPELREPFAKFQKVVNKAMAKQPKDRYVNCSELVADMQRAMGGFSDGREKAGVPSNRAVLQLTSSLTMVVDWLGRKFRSLFTGVSRFSRNKSNQNSNWLSRNSMLLIGGIGVLAVVVGGYVLWPNSQEVAVEPLIAEQVSTETPIVAALPEEILVTSPIDPELADFLANPLAEEGSGADEVAFQAGLQLPEETVADLLQKASAFYRANALTTPQGNNAYESYQQVLAIEPSNNEALQGIVQIVEKYKELAEGRLEEAEFDAAESLVNRAIRIAPDNAQLPELLDRIDDERIKKEAEELRQQINRLLAFAAEKAQNGNLITPDQDNALFYYQQVLNLDPANTTARGQLQNAGNQQIPEINLQISLGQFEQARELIELSERLYPRNPNLVEPKKRYSDLLDVTANATGPHITDAGIAKTSVLGQIFSKDNGQRLSMYFTHEGFRRDSPPFTLKLLDGNRSTVLATENAEVTGSSTRKVVNFHNESGFENGWYELDILLGERFLRSIRFELER